MSDTEALRAYHFCFGIPEGEGDQVANFDRPTVEQFDLVTQLLTPKSHE